MRVYALIFILITILLSSCEKKAEVVDRPKIVIGIVVDQMRWDYLYRYYNRYESGGFRRLLRNGYECRQTSINYLPTFTGPGHACIYTGSVPAIHGIAGNEWYDIHSHNVTYCVYDSNVSQVGGDNHRGAMSPVNLHTTTVSDELKLATNFKSKVYGIAIKDRSSILPAGHLADAAYWYDGESGEFVSSTHYSNPKPAWLTRFNQRLVWDSLLRELWVPLYDISSYEQSTSDSNGYEATYNWESAPVFPHRFDTLAEELRKSAIKSTPAGNTYTLMMAKACIEGEQLGSDNVTDFLAISLSSTDYVGHRYAPNSIEVEDTYLRLDKDIADLLSFFDKQFGRDGYMVLLTADHGGAHNARFMVDHNVPAGVEPAALTKQLNRFIDSVYNVDECVVFTENYQICLNERLIEASGANREKIRTGIIEWLQALPQVAFVVDMEDFDDIVIPEPIKTMIVNGYHRSRSGSIQIVLQPAWYDMGGRYEGTTHGSWNPYDSHIPLLWFGWHVPKGSTAAKVNMTDIAPTIADMLHIQMPNGCVGNPINMQ